MTIPQDYTATVHARVSDLSRTLRHDATFGQWPLAEHATGLEGSELPEWADRGCNFHSLADAKQAARLLAIQGRHRIAIDKWPINGTHAYCLTSPHDSPVWERVFVMRPGLCDLSPYNFSAEEYTGNTGLSINHADGITVIEQ